MAEGNKKLAFFLPNSFTALNMACGFAGIMSAFKGNFYFACMCIAFGAIFDSVDGRIARMTGTQSSFGEQFDSLSDLISFGIAPAIIFYLRFFQDMDGRFGYIATFLYLLCGALRLARFNANIDKVKSDYFQGLPIPGAAAAIVGYVFLSLVRPEMLDQKLIGTIYLIFYSMLMISNIPFPSFKNSEWVRKNKKKVFIILISLIALIASNEEVMLFVVISFYVFSSLFVFLKNREKFAGIFEWKNEQETIS